MTQPITFTINDQEINLIFNTASLNAMNMVMFGNQTKAFELSELLGEINRINEENFWFAAKIIIYSGIIGNDLKSNSYKPRFTFAEVGDLVGMMTEPELIEYTTKVWEAFLDQLGVNLEQLKEVDSDTITEKKK